MSEVRVACPQCEGTFQYPPCTTVTKLKCPQCGSLLTAANLGEILRRRRRNREERPVELVLAGAAAGPRTTEVEEPPMAPPMDTILQRESKPRRRLAVHNGLAGQFWLILIAGAMLAFQYGAPDVREYLPWYVMGRNVLLAGIVSWILVDAWRSSVGHGLTCMFFPPYILLYAIGQVESVLLRGLVFGLLIGLTGEAWLLPSQSLVLSLGPMFSSLVDQVNSWMAAAARPPV